jgi:hypothetical protein
MTKLVVVAAACAWLAACSGKSDGEPPQLLGGSGSQPSGGEPAQPPATGTAGDGRAENLPPELVSFEAETSAVEANGSTALTVRVRDAENDPFRVWWDSSCGIVSATANDASRAIFLAPSEPGVCTVTAQIQDADLQNTREYVYQLQVLPSSDMEVVDDL